MKINRTFQIAVLTATAVMLLLTGCSSLSVYKKEGLKLMRAGKFDEAMAYYEKMLKENPENTELRTMRFKARLNSYYYHRTLARKWREAEKKDEAVKEYRLALALFPDNKQLQDELDLYTGDKRIEKKPFVSYIKPPVTLKVDASEKISLNLRNTPIKQIFKMLGKSSNVNFIFDKDFRDFVYTIEIADIGFFDILNQLCLVSSAKYRILDEGSVLVFADTTFKRKTFGLQGVKVFFLSNTKAEDTKKLVLTLFRDQQIQVQEDTNMNSLIIKGTASTLRSIERFIHSVDKEKSEVEIDVEILELNRNLINAIGLAYGDTLSTVTMGRQDADGNLDTTNTNFNVNDLNGTNFFITLPSAALNFLESDDNSKLISKPNLRGVDGEEIKFAVGDEIPVPQTQFQAGAAGGVTNIPVTSYQYKSVGVDVKITPFIHRNGEVSLKVKLKIDFITGYRGDFPTLGKRELETIIRLKEGESSIIGGLIRDEMRGGVKGMPSLSKLPIIGKLFGSTARTVNQTDLIFSITPRVIRQMEVGEEEQNAIWSNTDTGRSRGSQSPGGAPPGPGENRAGARRPRGANSLIIAPGKRRVPVNGVSYFTIRINASTPVSSLSLAGSVSGAKAEIEEIKTDFFGAKDNAKVLKNTGGDSFDLGYSFDTKPIRNNVVAQLKIKFLEKGSYTIDLNSFSAYSKDRRQIELTASSAEVEAY